MESDKNLVSLRHSAFETLNRTSALGGERYVQARDEIITINIVFITQRPLEVERPSYLSLR